MPDSERISDRFRSEPSTEGRSIESRPPVFIVGMPRSGTKLLRDLLNRHPLVGIPEAETELLPDWAMRWPSFGDLEQPRCWAAFVEHARQSAYFVYLEEERGIAIDPAGWRLACPDFSLAGVFEGLCRLHGGAPLSGVWGDKSPGYLHHLPLIFTLFPRARVIHIVRDPRDQVQSAFKAWHKDRLRSAARWSEGIIAARDALKDTGRSSMVVRYEDLVASPAVVLKKICTLLEITFDPAMLQLGRPSENLGDTKGQTTVVAGNVEKWRQTMEPELQKRVQALCAEGLRAHGYPCTHEGPQHTLARTERQLRQVMDGINMIRFDLGARGVFGSIRFRWRLFSESGRWE